ncbi:MAG: cytochrome-c peroxidase [Saprospiraceae bacterium]|nr:cytochrome-c peroxidase [Saprospiraceae bacterium]
MGKKLFYDKRLSVDSTISCASCHKPSYAFADNTSMTSGVFGRQGVTNSPSLANVAYHPYYTREGGVPTLEMQVLVPVSEHNEFGFNIVEIAERLKNDTRYQEMSLKAYGRPLDPFVITRSISTFERSIISGDSKYDKYLKGAATLSAEEFLGKELFFSEKQTVVPVIRGIILPIMNLKTMAFMKSMPIREDTDLHSSKLLA